MKIDFIRFLFPMVLATLFCQNSISQSWDWADRAVGSSPTSYPLGAVVDDNSNVYIGGVMRGEVTIGSDTIVVGSSDDGVIVKYDSTGTLNWYAHFSSLYSDMKILDLEYDNGFIYACGWFEGTFDFNGITSSNSGSSRDAFLVKLDTLGNTVWVRTGGVSQRFDEATGVAIDENGDVYITGMCNHYWASQWSPPDLATFGSITMPFGYNEFYVVKYASDGTELWGVNSTGEQSDDYASDITCDKNGLIYIVGDYEDDISFGSKTMLGNPFGLDSFFISALDYNGNVIWVKTLGCRYESVGVAVDADTLGNIFVSATVYGTYNGFSDTLVLPNGERYFNLSFDTDGNNVAEELSPIRGKDLKVDNKGNMYLFGSSFGSSSKMGKFGLNCQEKWSINPTGNSSNYGLTGAVDPNSDHVFLGGYFYTFIQFGSYQLWTQNNYDMYLAQYHDNILDGTVTIDKPCSNVCEGVAVASGYKGAEPYTYQWSTGSTNDTVTNLCVGQHSVTIKDSNLDSVVINFEVFPAATIDTLVTVNELTMTASEANSYQWYFDGQPVSNGTDSVLTADANGTYYAVLTDSSGCSAPTEEVIIDFNCDSIDLDLLASSICFGDTLFGSMSDSLSSSSFEWVIANDTVLGNSISWEPTTSGQFNLDMKIVTPLCVRDSVIQIDVYPEYSDIVGLNICQGDSVLINGVYENSTGSYQENYQSIDGCDSTFLYNLTVDPTYTSTDVVNSCTPFTWIDGNTYTTSTTTQSVLSTVNGCDSVITLDLTILNSTSGIDVVTACDSYTWIDGNTYTSSNNSAQWTLTNSAGCDSLVTLDLTIVDSSSSTDIQSACNSFTWIDGVTYTSSNNSATHILTNTAGCDSLVTLDLTIMDSSSSTDIQSSCNSFTWIDGITYTSSNNTATHVLTNTAGCDSIVTLNLTINNVSDVSTSLNGLTISANNSSANYQWLDCDNGSEIIVGETNQSITVSNNGNYSVEITENGCVDTSSCVEVSTVGIVENNFGNKLIVYPNPTDGVFFVDLGENYSLINVAIINSEGKTIEQKEYQNTQLLDLRIDESKGVYLLIIESIETKAILRIIKN
ncbi:MAG: T9SS type A sorting domain-containing protein [Brumimicrobium sp.]